MRVLRKQLGTWTSQWFCMQRHYGIHARSRYGALHKRQLLGGTAFRSRPCQRPPTSSPVQWRSFDVCSNPIAPHLPKSIQTYCYV